jgi:hypothetical protein
MYRIRTDQEHYFRTDDHKVTPFWNEWNNRTTFDTTSSRYIAAIPKDDSNVKITLKAALTFSHIYLLIDLKYSKKAPTVSSMEVPMDGMAIYFAKQSLTSLQPSTKFNYTLVSTVLSASTNGTNYTNYLVDVSLLLPEKSLYFPLLQSKFSDFSFSELSSTTFCY